MASKTVRVAKVIRWANIKLGMPRAVPAVDHLTPHQAYRLGIASLLEIILHDSGNYRGFGYLESHVPGRTDETRRQYYVHPRLAEHHRDAQEASHTDVR